MPALVGGKLPEVFDFVEIFYRPAKVYERIRKRRTWLPAFFALVFLSTLPTLMVIYTAGIEMLTLQRYQNDPKLTERIGGDRAVQRAVYSSNERVTKLLIVSRVAGLAAVGAILLAAAFTAAVSVFEPRPNYFMMLGTVCISAFPFLLFGALVSAILLLSTSDQSTLNLENLPGWNVGRLLDRATANPAIYSMASEMDILLAGEILLMTFGLTKVSSLTFVQGLAICGTIWVVVVLWKAAWMVYM